MRVKLENEHWYKHVPKLLDTIYEGQVIPVEAWAGLEGSSRLRLPDFKTIGT
jgi:hypothetical protein